MGFGEPLQPADRIWEAISVSSFGKRLAKVLESWFPGSGLGELFFFFFLWFRFHIWDLGSEFGVLGWAERFLEGGGGLQTQQH